METRFEVCIRPDVGCVFVKHHGKLNADIILQRYAAIREHPDYKPPVNFYVEYLDCVSEMYASDVAILADYNRQSAGRRGNHKQVVLCNSSLVHGTEREFFALSDTNQVEQAIFDVDSPDRLEKIRRDALNWLGISERFMLPFST